MNYFKYLSAAGVYFCLLLSAGPVKADCEDPRNSFDSVYCFSKLYIDADSELNKAYQDLVAILNKDEKATLKNAEIAWIRGRNTQCSQDEGIDYYVDMNCAIEQTRQRTAYLKARRVECETGACDLSKLSE